MDKLFNSRSDIELLIGVLNDWLEHYPYSPKYDSVKSFLGNYRLWLMIHLI